jgi:hypothetical protein
MVQDEVPEDVKRLTSVREASSIIHQQTESVIVEPHSSLAEECKRLGDLKVAVNFPFAPYALEGLPSLLSHGTVK